MSERVATPIPEMSKLPETAGVLRRLIEQRDALAELDPWLPFPQTGCCFSFGGQKQPVPIGALFLLWSAGSPYVQPCQSCRQPAYMISFGGVLSGGGGSLVCPSCSHSWLHRIGGLIRIRELLATSPLETSAFRPTGMVPGGVIGLDGRVMLGRVFSSDGHQLCELLGVSRPTDQVRETYVRIEVGACLSMPLQPDRVEARSEDSVDRTGEKLGSASDARAPRYAGCIRHELNEPKDSQLQKQQTDGVVAHDPQRLASFVKKLKEGVKIEDMDDELKSWWLNRY